MSFTLNIQMLKTKIIRMLKIRYISGVVFRHWYFYLKHATRSREINFARTSISGRGRLGARFALRVFRTMDDCAGGVARERARPRRGSDPFLRAGLPAFSDNSKYYDVQNAAGRARASVRIYQRASAALRRVVRNMPPDLSRPYNPAPVTVLALPRARSRKRASS